MPPFADTPEAQTGLENETQPMVSGQAPPCTEAEESTSRTQAGARAVLGSALVALGAWTLHGFLPALVWAGVFGIALWPSYSWIRTRYFEQHPRAQRHAPIWLPLLCTLLVGLIFVLPVAMLAIEVAREAHGVVDWMSKAREHGMPEPDWIRKMPMLQSHISAWWQTHLSHPEDAADTLQSVDRHTVVSYGRNIGTQVVHRSILFGFMLLALFFIFKEGDTLIEQARHVSRRAFGSRGERISRQVIASIHGTVNGLVLVALGEGVILGVVYAIVGAPHAILLGAGTAAAAIIPLGAMAMVFCAGALILAKGTTLAAIIVVVFGVIVVFFADHFIRPVLIGGATKLPFLWVLLGILGGVETWGLLGLFVGPAIMATLILLWREWATQDTVNNPELPKA